MKIPMKNKVNTGTVHAFTDLNKNKGCDPFGWHPLFIELLVYEELLQRLDQVGLSDRLEQVSRRL